MGRPIQLNLWGVDSGEPPVYWFQPNMASTVDLQDFLLLTSANPGKRWNLRVNPTAIRYLERVEEGRVLLGRERFRHALIPMKVLAGPHKSELRVPVISWGDVWPELYILGV